MTQGVPGHAGELCRHECGLIHPSIEVVVVQVRVGVLRGEHPHGRIARNLSVRDRLGFLRQVDVLHTAALGGWRG